MILLAVVGVVVIAVVAGLAIYFVQRSRTVAASGIIAPPAAGSIGPEAMALENGTLLAPAPSALTGQPIDGVECNSSEQVAYHIHSHLAVFVDGLLRPVAPGIGMVQPVGQSSQKGDFYGASTCYYWLHVHAQDGVIHIEAPSETLYTLGAFFAVWGQPLSSTQVGPAKGTVTAYVNGKPYSGDPAAIQLTEREDIQLDIGSPTVSPMSVDWSKSQL